MVSTDVVRSVIGIIGNVISFGLFLSPTPTFYRIWKKGDVEDFSPIPYLATVMNCMLWVFYGFPIVHPHSLLVLTINGIGLVVELIYLCMYFTYSSKRQKVKPSLILLVEMVLMAIVVVVTLLVFHTHEKRTLFVGILCIIFGTCMYASPLSAMRLVIKTKSVDYMPFYLSLASFLNGVCWTIYALLPFDINIVIPNGLGTLFGAAQLVLYGCYFRSTPKKGKKAGGGDGGTACHEVELPTSTTTRSSMGPVLASTQEAVSINVGAP
ncbi:bidirectional sugar transporter SWEET6b-like [Nymphaea colorata]|nr:bidirectional sugar transporter SWEET6b-like [Nymphaea colorata]